MRRGLWGVLAILAVCGQSPSKEVRIGEAASPAAQKVYQLVMDNYRAYRGLTEPKVLSGCISVIADRDPPLRVHRVFAWHTDVSSDGPVFAGDLRRNAMRSCLGWTKPPDVECTCQMIDINGKNVLKL